MKYPWLHLVNNSASWLCSRQPACVGLTEYSVSCVRGSTRIDRQLNICSRQWKRWMMTQTWKQSKGLFTVFTGGHSSFPESVKGHSLSFSQVDVEGLNRETNGTPHCAIPNTKMVPVLPCSCDPKHPTGRNASKATARSPDRSFHANH